MSLTSIEMQPGSSRTAAPRLDKSCILTINCGSSSLKFALFTASGRPSRLLSGRVERIGTPSSRLVMVAADGAHAEDRTVSAPDQPAAIELLIKILGYVIGVANVAVVGHRVVHGGNRFYRPALVTPEMLEELRTIIPYDPDHLPGEIGAIEAFLRLDCELPQVACFDTA